MLIFLHVTNPTNLTHLTDLTSKSRENSNRSTVNLTVVDPKAQQWSCTDLKGLTASNGGFT